MSTGSVRNGAGSTTSLYSLQKSLKPVSPFYRFTFGDAEFTVVSDGPLPMGDPRDCFPTVPGSRISDLLEGSFLPSTDLVLQQNAPIVDFGGRKVLFDTGMGTLKQFGPTTGQLLKSLEAAGIDVEEIDAIVCSHAHWDHVGGILRDDGTATFPNAQIYISQIDHDFWTDDAKLGTPIDGLVKAAIHNLRPMRERIVFFNDGEEFLPGVHAIASPGHTLGHHCFMIESAGQTLCYLGDLTHHPVLMLEQPNLEFAFDTDAQMSIESRLRILNMLAANKTPILSYHFPWPGYGNVAKNGSGFRYYPQPLDVSAT